MKFFKSETAVNKIVLTDNQGGLVVNTCDIICCEAQNCYSLFHLSNGSKKIVCKTLKEFEKDLCGNEFVRIHRKYIINMDHVKSFERKQGSKVLMTNGMSMEISVRKKKYFLSKFLTHINADRKITLTKLNLTFT